MFVAILSISQFMHQNYVVCRTSVNIKLLLTFISTGYMQSCNGSKTATVCGATLAVLGAHDTLFDPKITCNAVLTEMCMPSGRSDVGMWW